jgi:hypothetical protein
VFSHEIEEDDFIEMFKDKYNREPTAEDFNRFKHKFFEMIQETGDEDEILKRLVSLECKVLDCMNDDEEEDQNEEDTKQNDTTPN